MSVVQLFPQLRGFEDRQLATFGPHQIVLPHARMNPKTVSASDGINHPHPGW